MTPEHIKDSAPLYRAIRCVQNMEEAERDYRPGGERV